MIPDRSTRLWLFPLLALACFLAAWRWRGETAPAAAASASCTLDHPRAFLGRRPPVPDARHLVESAEHNPGGVRLSPERLDGLQALVDRINLELESLQAPASELAREWANLRIQDGAFSARAPEEDVRADPGSILVRVLAPDGRIQEVQIHAGECAELDVLAADVDALVAAGFTEIERYLSDS